MLEKACLPIEISRFGAYTLKPLAGQHKNAVLQIDAQEFSKKDPLSLAYYKDMGGSSLESWRRYFQGLSHEYFESGMSVGCFNQQTNELVGSIICKIMDPIPQYKPSVVEKPDFWTVRGELSMLLPNSLTQTYKDLLQKNKGKVAQIRSAAIKNEHMGKQLIPKILSCIEYLAVKKGYDYIFSVASNVKSVGALTKLKYFNISKYDVSQFQYNGKRVFEKITEENKYLTLWLKPIREIKPILPKL